MIERNRNPAGKLFNLLFGLCEIADGFIRVISLGYLHSRFALDMSKRATKSHIARQKKRQAQMRLALDNAPIGTQAPSIMGGHWTKTERGWKWCTGATFPRPGGDWNGKLILPTTSKETKHVS